MQARPDATGGEAAAPARGRPLLHYKDLGLVTQNRKTRFTCVHASENFLACGTNNGSVYLYATSVVSRAESDARVFPAKYHLVKMITPPSNDRVGVTCLSICPQQKRLVVGTMRGVVYGIQLSDYNKIGEKVEFSHDFHAGFPITCFLWDKRGQRLFSACNGGSVSQTVLRAGVSAIFGSVDTELLLKEETGIVQLDLARYGRAYILLVSSQLRVLLLNLTSGDGSAVQIGTKARQGSFGACFFTSLNPDSIDPAKKRETKVFSARPGRRVWVADPQTGTVSSTLKFALGKNPGTFLDSTGCTSGEVQTRDLSVNKLQQFRFLRDPAYAPKDVKEANVLLVSWNVGSSVLFFLDPTAVEIVEWHIDLGVILDLQVVNETTLAVLHGEVPKVSLIRSCSAQEFIDIYGANDTFKKVELAVNFALNDAVVLRSLQEQWIAYLKSGVKNSGDTENLSSVLKALTASAELLEKEYQDATANELPGMDLGNNRQIQVIFKQRPQTAAVSAEPSTPDLFAAAAADGGGGMSPHAEKRVVTLETGHALHRPIEYFDVLATSTETYSKSISAPDGSTVEARLIDIPELPRAEPVLPIDLRQHFMEEIMDEVKTFERLRAEDGAMNNILPALRGSSSVAAKAFSTLIPNAGMFSNLMDASMITQPFQMTATGLFGSFPDIEDDLVIDPDPRLFQKSYTYGQLLARGSGADEYSVLRIAMSTADSEEDKLDSEVLLEAISMDIWDTNLKYVSNLPISEQLDLPSLEESARKHARAAKRTIESQPLATTMSGTGNARQRSSRAVGDAELSIRTKQEEAGTQKKQRLQTRLSMSPDAGRGALRALQKHLGAMPSCEVKHRCIVGGRIAQSAELEPVVKREVSELMSELVAASETAEKTRHLSNRLWPAAGITRVCACLANVFLLQGDLLRTQTTIEAWLNCFDPTAQPQDPVDPEQPSQSESGGKQNDLTGFARGEALVDGDGLPLTRNDWNLVRTLVSTYFAISAAGAKVQVRPLGPEDGHQPRIYEQQMGITVGLEGFYSNASGDTVKEGASASVGFGEVKLWSATEAETFVSKYGVYLSPDLAAEACNLAGFAGALTLVLDHVVSSADMAETCDDIKNWVAEQEFHRALTTVKERDSFCLLLHLLDLLMKKCPQETIEICVDKYPVLRTENVERSLFGQEISWSNVINGTDDEILKPDRVAQTARYFRYLVRLLEEKTAISGRDAQLVQRCLALSFVGLKVTGNLFELDGRGGLEEWVASLVAQPERFAFDHKWCWRLLVDNEALLGMLELIMHSLKIEATFELGLKELRDFVSLIVDKAELTFFEPLFLRIGALPRRSDAVQAKVLEQVHGSLSLDKRCASLSAAVISALLNAGDLESGMRLLSRFPLMFASAPLSMYHTIVESHALSEQQKHEVNQMLEIADTNAWASYKEAAAVRGALFPPQLSAALQVELRSLRPALEGKQLDAWTSTCEQYNEDPDAAADEQEKRSYHYSEAASVLPSRSFEYRNSGWGGEVQLHDSVCAMCELSVFIIAEGNSNLDVVLLPCGHAFHCRCLDEDSCPVCLEDNMSTLDWLS